MKFLSLLLLTLAAMPASAGSLYKCVDSKGNSAYQETPFSACASRPMADWQAVSFNAYMSPMDSRESMKINRLLQAWPGGTVALHAFFTQHGVSRKLAEQYRKTGWIDSVGVGAFVRRGDKVSWQGALYAVQAQPDAVGRRSRDHGAQRQNHDAGANRAHAGIIDAVGREMDCEGRGEAKI